jgi:hypothetical protein
MRRAANLALLSLLLAGVGAGQSKAMPQPRLPLVNDNACPFEGCTFGKWIIRRDTPVFSTWQAGRKPVITLRKGDTVTGLTGVHITFEPDQIRVTKAVPGLHLAPGDIILRYMYRGEGFADIWAKGVWNQEYDCSFVTEKVDSGCARDCSAQVISDGRKEWWVQLKTSRSVTGWAKVEAQFDCMDSLGGDPKCEHL